MLLLLLPLLLTLLGCHWLDALPRGLLLLLLLDLRRCLWWRTRVPCGDLLLHLWGCLLLDAMLCMLLPVLLPLLLLLPLLRRRHECLLSLTILLLVGLLVMPRSDLLLPMVPGLLLDLCCTLLLLLLLPLTHRPAVAALDACCMCAAACSACVPATVAPAAKSHTAAFLVRSNATAATCCAPLLLHTPATYLLTAMSCTVANSRF